MTDVQVCAHPSCENQITSSYARYCGRTCQLNARVTRSIRLSPELFERLQEAAKDRDLSLNFLVTEAIEEFLDKLIPVDELRLTR